MEIYWQNSQDQAHAELLIEQNIIQADGLKDLVLKRQASFQKAHQKLHGQLYQLDESHAICAIKDSLTLSTLRKLELIANYELHPCTRNYGQDILLLDPENPRILGLQTFKSPQTLLHTDKHAYLYHHDLAQDTHLAQTNTLYCPYLPELSQRYGSFDFTFSSDQRHLCISDRKDGSVFFLDTLNYELKETYQLRADGGEDPLFLVVDDSDEMVYFIDGKTPHLYVLELGSGALEQYLLEPEVPCHILLDAEARCLYLLIKGPRPKIKALSLETLDTLAEYEIPTLYSFELENRLHLLSLSPNGKQLSLLTHTPQHAVVFHFSTANLNLLKKENLPPDIQPYMLAYGIPNPLKGSMSLKDIILDEGILTQDTWDALLLKANEQVKEAPSPAESAPEIPELPFHISKPEERHAAACMYLSPLAKPQAWSQPHPDDTLLIPEDITEDILNILTGTFYQQTGLDLNAHPDALQRFVDEARKARLKLQDFDAYQAQVPNVLGQGDFKTMVYRSSLQTIMSLRTQTQKHYTTPPTHCPSCHHPLLGSWDYGACGLELENPIRHYYRELASWEPQHWLPPDFFALPDLAGGRLLLINTRSFQYVTWELNLRALPFCEEPTDVLWMDQLHVLVTDAKTNELFEVSSSGKVRFRYEPRTPEAQLLRPVKTTVYINSDGEKRYLVVDQGNHRILELDQDSAIQWEFGVKGEAGSSESHLNAPTDIQFTHEQTYLITDTGNHRVLEVVGNKVHQHIGEEKLDQPIYAQRLFNGDTVIVDYSGSIYVFDASLALIKQSTYSHSRLKPELQMTAPLKVFRRQQKTFVFLDHDKINEVDPATQSIVWSSTWAQLKLAIAQDPDPKDEVIKRPMALAFDAYGPPPPAGIITLRQMIKEVILFEDAPDTFFDAIEQNLKVRNFKAGEHILEKGRLSRAMYFIQNGKVAVLAEKGDEPVLLLQSGDSFGYMSLVFSELRKSTVVCHENCSLVVLERKAFERIILKYPKIEARAKKLAAQRMVISRLKKTPKHQPSAKLQALIARHKSRAAQRSQETSERLNLKSKAIAVSYSEAEEKLIQLAPEPVFEVTVTFYKNYRMKLARLYLVSTIMSHFSTLLKTTPNYEGEPEANIGNQFVFTLHTPHQAAQIIEDLTAIAEVETVTTKRLSQTGPDKGVENA